MAGIVLVEDSNSIREMVTEYLRLSDHVVREFSSGESVVDAVRKEIPDLCILDLMVPGKGGFQIAKEIRTFSSVPILFLTARDDEGSRITGFEVGADDYVVKPFSPRELVLRVEAILRRSEQRETRRSTPETVSVRSGTSELVLHHHTHRLFRDGKEVELTNTEWRILAYMLDNPAIVITRERIMESVLDYAVETNSRTIDSHVKNLRSKIGAEQWIETVRGVGYRFIGTVGER